MSLEFIIPALLIGIGGSLHCLGMCGPLMMTAVFRSEDGGFQVSRWLTYHTGRILVYALWGALFGLAGSTVRWFGIQQNISLSLGIGILLMVVLVKWVPSFEQKIGNLSVLKFARAQLMPFLQTKGYTGPWISGMLNGLLPCGLVYVALAGATAVQDVMRGALFMSAFGIGTLPLLTVVLLAGNTFSTRYRRTFSRWYPYMIGIMAILLIVRGANLGNMLSPALLPGNQEMVHCVED